MPVIAELTTEAQLAELDRLEDVGRLMRQRPAGLASVPPPVPLHRMNREPGSGEAAR